jgi:hypothetical protein
LTVTPSCLPASVAPFLTTFQNVSPALPWVITATVSGPDAAAAPPPLLGAGVLPPVFELSLAGPLHAASTSVPAAARPRSRPRTRRPRGCDLIVLSFE